MRAKFSRTALLSPPGSPSPLSLRSFGRGWQLGFELKSTTKQTGPFAGLLVLDLTRVLAGPYAALMLGEMGARIIQIEPPVKGDDSRHIGPFVKTKTGKVKSGYFMSVNRGKESIALDLKSDADRKIFEALLAR